MLVTEVSLFSTLTATSLATKPVGMVHCILVSDHNPTVASVELKVTVGDEDEPKFEPSIVIVCPANPLSGLIDVMAGIGASVTSKAAKS